MTNDTTIAQLRHLYANLMNGAVRDTASAKRIATGLLGPVIEKLEAGTQEGEPSDAMCVAMVKAMFEHKNYSAPWEDVMRFCYLAALAQAQKEQA